MKSNTSKYLIIAQSPDIRNIWVPSNQIIFSNDNESHDLSCRTSQGIVTRRQPINNRVGVQSCILRLLSFISKLWSPNSFLTSSQHSSNSNTSMLTPSFSWKNDPSVHPGNSNKESCSQRRLLDTFNSNWWQRWRSVWRALRPLSSVVVKPVSAASVVKKRSSL